MKETRTNHRANMFIKFTRIVKLHTQIPHKKKKKVLDIQNRSCYFPEKTWGSI